MSRTGPPTILFDVFWTQQLRKRLLEAALEGTEVDPEDYPFYVVLEDSPPLTPTALADQLLLPLTTTVFRIKRLEKRGHARRLRNPEDGRSYLVTLTAAGKRLLDRARPSFRDYATAVEARLGAKRVASLRSGLASLRDAIDEELAARDG
jgi:DNA-binding MarR family transcriptional regulator